MKQEKSFFRQLLETFVGLAIIAIAAMMFLNSPAQGGSVEFSAVKVEQIQPTSPAQSTVPAVPTDPPTKQEDVPVAVPTSAPAATDTPVPPTEVPPTNTPVPTLAPSDGSAQGQLWHSCNRNNNCNTLDGVNVIVRQEGRQWPCDMPTVQGNFVCHHIKATSPFNIEFVYDGQEFYGDPVILNVEWRNGSPVTLPYDFGELTIQNGRIIPLADYLNQN